MRLDGPVKHDHLFKDDLDAKLMLILQRVFFMGVLVGKNAIEDDMNAASMPLNQAVQSLMQELGKLVPGIQQAVELSSNTPEGDELAKSEKNSKRYNVLDYNYKKLEDHHDLTVNTLLENMEKQKKTFTAKTAQEVAKFKKKK